MSNAPNYCIAFCGGGTGGHVYPALAVLQNLRQLIAKEQPGAKVTIIWLGSKSGIEKNILARPNITPDLRLKYYGISCGKLRRYFSWKNFRDLFSTIWGIVQSYRILQRERPCLLFSKGGFVAVPSVFAAKMLGITVLAHESDIDPGLATRLSLPLLTTLFLPYEQSRKYYKVKYQKKLQVSGNPVRREFFAEFYGSTEPCFEHNSTAQFASASIPRHWFNATGKLRRPLLLIIGGSLGASELNKYVQEWLQNNVLDQCYILHQCGENAYGELKTRLKKQGQELPQNTGETKHQTMSYHVLPFIADDLGAIYQLCRQSGGLLVSRSGAGSLWEILASGNESVLVPLQSGSRGDQLRNAQFFAKEGWAHCFIAVKNQKNGQKLLEQILAILQDGTARERAYIPDAASYIAQRIWQQAQQKK